MTIGIALNSALSGLRVNQQSIAVLSNNIANANTEGYSRQVVEQSAIYVEGVGLGVRFDAVVRKVDKYLQNAVQEYGARMSSASVASDYASRVQVLLGEPGGQNTLDEYVTGFFNSLQALAETPERASYRTNVTQSANTLTREVSNLALGLQQLRYQADQDMQDAVTAINALLKKLDNVNAAIGRSQALGQSSAGLYDERDMALKQLSEYTDIDVFFAKDGQANVYTGNGVPLVDGNRHEVRYMPLSSIDAFVDGKAFGAMTVATLNAEGNLLGAPVEIMSAGVSAEVTSRLTGGKLHALQQVRDATLPQILSELDMFASRMRDEMNRVHNMGTSYPPPTSLTGTRMVKANDVSEWTGLVRIAVLTSTGDPVTAGYPNESGTGLRPLTLNLASLNSGNGVGKPSMQTIIDEINNYYSAPQIKTSLGPLNNVKLVSNTDQLPNSSPALFNFDLELENITGGNANVFVTGVTVRDDTAADITNVTNSAPVISLADTGTYQTFVGQDYFTITTDAPAGLTPGQTIYLPDPGGLPALMGDIPSANFVGYFEVASVMGNQVTLRFPPMVFTNTAESIDSAASTVVPPYDTILPGEYTRTTDSGTFTANLGGAPGSAYYDISVNVGVVDEDGNVTTSTITYRVANNEENLRNLRYNSTAATGDATRTLPYSSQSVMRAMLVDANGKEIQKIDGKYIDQPGYLKLVTTNGEYTVAIDSLDSRQVGDASAVPFDPGTGRGFSHYFELNNFFASNIPTKSGDTIEGSALNMALEDRLLKNPALLATGKLSLSQQSSDPTAPPRFTYVRNSGDNTFAQALAAVSTTNIAFGAAGTISATNMSLTTYLGEMLGSIASRAVAADAEYSNAETLYNGFKTRLDAVTGVNLDEELANTIIYQNAYTASARIVKIADELYEDLLAVF